MARLMLSVRPDLKAKELKEILMKTVTELPALMGKVKLGGMPNAYRAVQNALDYPRAAPSRCYTAPSHADLYLQMRRLWRPQALLNP
jgi:hypothetical protein